MDRPVKKGFQDVPFMDGDLHKEQGNIHAGPATQDMSRSGDANSAIRAADRLGVVNPETQFPTRSWKANSAIRAPQMPGVRNPETQFPTRSGVTDPFFGTINPNVQRHFQNQRRTKQESASMSTHLPVYPSHEGYVYVSRDGTVKESSLDDQASTEPAHFLPECSESSQLLNVNQTVAVQHEGILENHETTEMKKDCKLITHSQKIQGMDASMAAHVTCDGRRQRKNLLQKSSRVENAKRTAVNTSSELCSEEDTQFGPAALSQPFQQTARQVMLPEGGYDYHHRFEELKHRWEDGEREATRMRNMRAASLLQDLKDFKSRIVGERAGESVYEKLGNDVSEFEKKLRDTITTKGNDLMAHEGVPMKMLKINQLEANTPSEVGSESFGQYQSNKPPFHMNKATPTTAHTTEVSPITLRQDIEEEPAAKADEYNSIDLLLIGSLGNGKSATGNSILNRPEFKKSASSSVSSEPSSGRIMTGSTCFKDKVVNVIDGPGICYSDNIQPEHLKTIVKDVEASLQLCNYAFSALLVVLKFGGRFTKQEAEMIRVIKYILGADVIKDYAVCVLTHGDDFENAVEEAECFGEKEKLTFDGWVKQQVGDVKFLFEECKFGCVLFDNLTKNAEKKRTQLDALMSKIPQGKRYSKEEFQLAEKGRQELATVADLPFLLQHFKAMAEEIREKMNKVEQDEKIDIATYMSNMETLLSEIRGRRDVLPENGPSSVDVDGIQIQLKSLEQQINNKIRCRLTSDAIEREKTEKTRRKSGMRRANTLPAHKMSQESQLQSVADPEVENPAQTVGLALQEGDGLVDSFRENVQQGSRTFLASKLAGWSAHLGWGQKEP